MTASEDFADKVVIPAPAGTQGLSSTTLDSRVRGNDEVTTLDSRVRGNDEVVREATSESTISVDELKRRRWHELVSKYERLADESPSRHRIRIIAMIAASYLYVAGLLTIAVVCLALLVGATISVGFNIATVKLGIPLAAIAFVIARSFWVSFDHPDGVALTRQDAPELWKMTEEVASSLKAPAPEQILLTFDFNAAAIQRPRFGIFGGYRNFLQLGATLMHAISEEEVRAVIAHEYGHFSRQHGKLGTWVRRAMEKWTHLMDHARKGGSGRFLIKSFGLWWMPKFAAATIAMRRKQEHQADADAASVTSGRTLSAALCRMRILNDLVIERRDPAGVNRENFIDHERERVSRQLSVIGSQIAAEPARESLERALKWTTVATDSHPALAERLRAMGVDPVAGFHQLVAAAAAPREPSAAGALLRKGKQELLEDYFRQLTRLFPHLLVPLNEFERKKAANERASLALLEQRYATQRLDVHQKAMLVGKLHSAGRDDKAEKLAREVISESSEGIIARFVLASVLLERRDAEGVEHMERVVSIGGDKTATALAELAEHWRKLGDRERYDDAKRRRSNWRAQDQREMADAASRRCVSRLSPALLASAERAALREAAEGVALLGRVYAVTHTSAQTGDKRLLLYLFASGWMEPDEDEQEAVLKAFTADFRFDRPGALVAPQHRGKWQKKLDEISDALVYDKKAEAAGRP